MTSNATIVNNPNVPRVMRGRLLSSANTTKPDHIGQAFKVGDNPPELLSRLIYFGLLLVARRTRFQIHSGSTLTADVTFTSLRRNRN